MSNKPFKTYQELVSKLKDEKKLEVPDEERVIELLKMHGCRMMKERQKTNPKEVVFCLFQSSRRFGLILKHA